MKGLGKSGMVNMLAGVATPFHKESLLDSRGGVATPSQSRVTRPILDDSTNLNTETTVGDLHQALLQYSM